MTMRLRFVSLSMHTTLQWVASLDGVVSILIGKKRQGNWSPSPWLSRSAVAALRARHKKDVPREPLSWQSVAHIHSVSTRLGPLHYFSLFIWGGLLWSLRFPSHIFFLLFRVFSLPIPIISNVRTAVDHYGIDAWGPLDNSHLGTPRPSPTSGQLFASQEEPSFHFTHWLFQTFEHHFFFESTTRILCK